MWVMIPLEDLTDEDEDENEDDEDEDDEDDEDEDNEDEDEDDEDEDGYLVMKVIQSWKLSCDEIFKEMNVI